MSQTVEIETDLDSNLKSLVTSSLSLNGELDGELNKLTTDSKLSFKVCLIVI